MLFVAGCAGSSPIGALSADIVGGSVTSADPAIVLLRGRLSNGDLLCTGTVIAPTVVLTAAHCVDPRAVGEVASYDVFFGSDLATQGSVAANWMAVSATDFDDAFDPAYVDRGHDVGVALLESSATVSPLPMNQAALSDAAVGQPLRVVGFGVTAGSDTSASTAGVKRQMQTPLVAYDDCFIRFGSTTTNTCNGDSGGPALMTVDGQSVVVGITSFGQTGCVDGATDTRVDTIAAPFASMFLDAPADGGAAGGGTSAALVAPVAGGGGVAPVRGGCSVARAGADGDAAALACVLLLAVAPLLRRRARPASR